MAITPKNWASFQHYKDRAPQWIKLHRGLLDNIDYHLLTPVAAKCLPLFWLIASEKDGALPEVGELAFRLRMSEADVDGVLAELLRRDFLVHTDVAKPAEQVGTLAQRLAKSNGFGSRHISDATKRSVWARDGGICKKCGAAENIEYDHIHPVSKGGNSEVENIQLLCRPCNRSKRVRIDTEDATAAEQFDTEHLDSRSLEKRREENKIEENIVAKAPIGNSDFEKLKQVYPKRAGNYGWKAAEKKFNSLVKTGVDPAVIIAAAVRLCQTLRSKIGTEFIPMPASWLNSEDFAESAADAFVAHVPAKGYYAAFDSPQLDAWDKHNRSLTGRLLPRDLRGGWQVDSEWPPGYTPLESLDREAPSLALRSMQ